MEMKVSESDAECVRSGEDVRVEATGGGSNEAVMRDGTVGHTSASRITSRKHISPHRRRRKYTRISASTGLCVLLASGLPTSMAQNCVSLADSTKCSAFSAASVSTNDALVGLFPFLSSVTDTSSFDSGLQAYIEDGFARLR